MKQIVFILVSIVLSIFLYLNITIKDRKLNVKVLFINQVRGGECCQKGSFDLTKNQLELFKKYNFPSTFVMRYDALKDNRYIALFKTNSTPLVDIGIFFEITPSLANDAGVVYKGTEDRWYRAQYAYLIGYTQEERIKIIDTGMELYFKQFGKYPQTTGGWMIDTYSADYLSKKYGVTAHEITREQWGTDGYALYGGHISSVYVPSKKWIFVPATSEEDALPIRIIRQTISDPVRNYGDLTSGYTSQPNDYGRTKMFGYFKHLLSQVEKYSQPIAVLGLENSLEKKYQDIYTQQISHISKVIDKSNILLPKKIIDIDDQSYSFGSEYLNKTYKAFWIQTAFYRVRIIQLHGRVYLTDLRVYNSKLIDPFFMNQSGDKTAFWETPYIFDSSKKGLPKDTTEYTRQLGQLFTFFGNPDWLAEHLNPVLNEKYLYEINGIELPRIKVNSDVSIHRKNKVIYMQYVRDNGVPVVIQFNDKDFVMSGVHRTDYKIYGSIGEGTQLMQEQKNDGIHFTPRLSSVKEDPKDVLNTIPTEIPNEAQLTIIYNAPLSLIGRNPVRLVVVSKDAGGRSVRLKTMTVTHTNGNFDSVRIFETEGHLGEFDGMYYVDIDHKSLGTYTPILNYDDKQMKLKPISFVFDCKQSVTVCLASPQKLIEYMKVKVGDMLNRR